jgi:hypothetical protein
MGAPPLYSQRMANFGGTDSEAGLKEMHHGYISPHSARKIRNAVDWLLAAAKEKWVYSKKNNRFYKWKLSFLTLTLPTQGQMTDLEVKSVLNSFLTLAKYNYGLRSYIWKAEPQARGVIHFHLTSDCYMWKNSVRFEWNRLLRKSGLLNNHDDPPTTKIHSTYRVKNMSAYLTKYFIKANQNENYPPLKPSHLIRTNKDVRFTREEFVNSKIHNYIRPINGRLWGCSHSLSQARNLSYIVDSDEMRSLNSELRKESTRETQKDYCNFFFLKDGFYQRLPAGAIRDDYNNHLSKIRKKRYFHQFEIYDSEGEIITHKSTLKKFKRQTGVELNK